MAEPTAEQLLKRADKAWERKVNWDDTYRDAYKFALPQRDLYDRPRPGQVKGDEVFDSTAVTATARFANRMQSGLTPPFRKWAALKPGPLVPPDRKDELAKQLEEITEKLFAVIDISNFNTAINEFYLDLCAGTAVMFVEEGDDKTPVYFHAAPQIQVALEEGPRGRVDGVFRKHKIAARNIEKQWRDAKLPTALAEKVRDNPDTEIVLKEATFYDSDQDGYLYDVLWPDNKESILRKRRVYAENPWIVTRWIKAANEVQGRGPLLYALPDIKTLNKLVELILKNASLDVSGVYTAVDDGVVNPHHVRFVPGAVIPVGRNGGSLGPSLAPLPRSGDFDVAQLEREDLRMGIKKALFDNTLPRDAGPVRSATEILERTRELADDIGAAFGRLMLELVQPLIQRVMGIMFRKGLIETDVKITGSLVQVQVVSPLAMQQNTEEVKTVFDWLQLIAGMGPEMMLLGAKVENVPSWAGRKLGVPEKLMRDETERDAMQAQIAEMIAKQALAQNPSGAAAMAGAGNPAAGGAAQ